MFAAFEKIEAAVRADWSELSGEARRDAEQAITDLKTEVGKVKDQLEADAAKAIEAAGPSVQAAVQAVVAAAVSALGKLIGEDL